MSIMYQFSRERTLYKMLYIVNLYGPDAPALSDNPYCHAIRHMKHFSADSSHRKLLDIGDTAPSENDGPEPDVSAAFVRPSARLVIFSKTLM